METTRKAKKTLRTISPDPDMGSPTLPLPSPRILGPSAPKNTGVAPPNGMSERLVKSLSVIFPAFNEEGNIRAVVEDAYQNIWKFTSLFEIIVVNDGSKDRTGDICDRLVEELPEVRVVHHARNQGYGAALKSGIQSAQHDLIFFTDADGQFDIKEVAALLEDTDAYDIVAGYRAKRQDPPHRLLFAWGWNILVRIVLGIRIRDIDCAFKVFHRRVFNKVQIQSVGAMVNTEIFAQIFRFGMTVKEVPVTHFPRRHGQSTGGKLAVIMKAFRELFRIRRKVDRIAAVIRRVRRVQARQKSCNILSTPPSLRNVLVSASLTSECANPFVSASVPE
jgi:glycosyltransferase involved in cell wall biosynthesis